MYNDSALQTPADNSRPPGGPVLMTTTEAREGGKAPARRDNGWEYTAEHFPAGQHTPGSYRGQLADVYARHTGVFALDVDAYKEGRAEAWEQSATGRFLAGRAPYVQRGTGGSMRYLVAQTPEQAAEWHPVASGLPWGEIRSAGLGPSPGARHPSGDTYEHVPGPDPVRYPDGTVLLTNVVRFSAGLREALEADGAHSRDDRPMTAGDAGLPDDDGRCPLVLGWLESTADLAAATSPRGTHANRAVNYLKRLDAEGHHVGGWVDEVTAALPHTGEADFEAMWATAPVPADTVPLPRECCPEDGPGLKLPAASLNGQQANAQAPLDADGTIPELAFFPAAQVPFVPPPTLKLVAASGITPEPVRWLWRDRLKLGGLALLAGDVGLGKSTVGVDVTAQLTRGTLPGEYLGAPQNVIICATEDAWSDTVVPRLMAAGADLDRVYQLTAAAEYGADLMLPVQVPELAGLITGSGARLVVLDPLMSRLDGRLDSHKDAEVRRALEPLVRMAEDTGVTVLGLIHQNKGGASNAVDRVMGSRAFTAVARSVLYAAPLLSKDPTGGTLVLAVAKSNNAPRGTADAYRIAPCTLTGPQLITTTRIHWLSALEQFSLDAELAEAGKRQGTTAVDRAAEWLAGYLARNGGRADSAGVRTAGREAGHSVSTLKRAMAEAGVTTERTSEARPRTVWVLEDYDPTAPVPRARGDSPPVELTELTSRQENIYELTTTNYLGKRPAGQLAQLAQDSGPPREVELTESGPPPAPVPPPAQPGPTAADIARMREAAARFVPRLVPGCPGCDSSVAGCREHVYGERRG